MMQLKTSQTGITTVRASVLSRPEGPGSKRSKTRTTRAASDQKAPCSATPESAGRRSGFRMAASARVKRFGMLRPSVTRDSASGRTRLWHVLLRSLPSVAHIAICGRSLRNGDDEIVDLDVGFEV